METYNCAAYTLKFALETLCGRRPERPGWTFSTDDAMKLREAMALRILQELDVPHEVPKAPLSTHLPQPSEAPVAPTLQPEGRTAAELPSPQSIVESADVVGEGEASRARRPWVDGVSFSVGLQREVERRAEELASTDPIAELGEVAGDVERTHASRSRVDDADSMSPGLQHGVEEGDEHMRGVDSTVGRSTARQGSHMHDEGKHGKYTATRQPFSCTNTDIVRSCGCSC